MSFSLDTFNQIRLLEGIDEIQFIFRYGTEIAAFECGGPGCGVPVVYPPDPMSAF